MRKFLLLLISLCTLIIFSACGSRGDVKVYTSTGETVVTHIEENMTAVITDIDLENNIISFIDCISGETFELIYHGGVSVLNTYGNDIGIKGVNNGSVVDVCYYSDTSKLVSISVNSSATVIEGVKKFSADTGNNTAKYKGTSCNMWEHVVAFDGDTPLDIMEINTEDQVTLTMYGGKLVSVVIELGHGYVRLNNQDTYIGGMVEIGYDVIVPVTADMLVAVTEGEYTLRIHNGDYSDSKPVTVVKGQEVIVDLYDIAIPTGTVTFNITPSEAILYVNGYEQDAHAYTNLYGTYNIRVTMEGYSTFNGSFKISKPVNSFDIELTELETEEEEDATTETTTEAATEGSTDSQESTDTSTESDSSESTTQDATESGETTGNTITIKTPVGAGVYVDGDYVGVAPVTFPKVVGTHTITLYKSGYLIKSYTIQAADDGKNDEHSFAALTSVLDVLE